MARHELVDPVVFTAAQVVDQAVRRHLAALMQVAQSGADDDVLRVARAEIPRTISALCSALRLHALDAHGYCVECAAPICALRADLRTALQPVHDVTDL